MSMSEFLTRIKEVAKADTRLFFEPYVAVYNWVRRKFGRPA